MPSNIGWTQETWNPILGCNIASEGCLNCYAAKGAHRMKSNPNARVSDAYAGLTTPEGKWNGVIRFLPERLQKPLEKRKPTIWFVNSMSDLFHPRVELQWIDQVLAVCALTSQHRYYILTKRAERLPAYFAGDWYARVIFEMAALMPGTEIVPSFPLENVAIGVSVENQREAERRIPPLQDINAAYKVLSLEPQLEDLSLGTRLLKGIDQVFQGGESGDFDEVRSFNVDWARNMRDQCEENGVRFYLKQLGVKVDGLPLDTMPWMADSLSGKNDNPDLWPEDLKGCRELLWEVKA